MILREFAVLVVTFFLLTVLSGCEDAKETVDGDYDVELETDKVGSSFPFPPKNPFLADSEWPISHGNSYVQASSPLPGPVMASEANLQFVEFDFPSIVLAYSGIFSDGGRVVWGSNLSSVFKIDPETNPIQVIAKLDKADNNFNPIVGAYTLIDQDNVFFVPTKSGIRSFTDVEEGNRLSGIVERDSITFPENEIRGELLAINLTFDGMLVFATSKGTVGIVSRDFSTYQTINLDDGEEISNSLAVDETGGIYVVTSRKMRRVQWTGQHLSLDSADGAWSANYETGEDLGSGRLGLGSGSTPSLMGVDDQDRFVVITDGQELMHLVMFWREEIPQDWQAIAPGKDRRIAAEIPITFGDEDATHSISEQSVLILGYQVVVVSNDYGEEAGSGMMPVIQGLPAWGVEQFTWDPETRVLKQSWFNKDVGCPNGIPTMSAASGLFYCIGKREDNWTLEALDWGTGESAFFKVIGEDGKYNTTYAATEVGHNGNIITGTFKGVVQLGK